MFLKKIPLKISVGFVCFVLILVFFFFLGKFWSAHKDILESKLSTRYITATHISQIWLFSSARPSQNTLVWEKQLTFTFNFYGNTSQASDNKSPSLREDPFVYTIFLQAVSFSLEIPVCVWTVPWEQRPQGGRAVSQVLIYTQQVSLTLKCRWYYLWTKYQISPEQQFVQKSNGKVSGPACSVWIFLEEDT